MTTKEVLLAAADYLETHGWCQDTYVRGERCCVLGALSKVQGLPVGFSDSGEAAIALERYIKVKGVLPGEFVANIPGWNDAPGRTAEEVISALRAAAEGVES